MYIGAVQEIQDDYFKWLYEQVRDPLEIYDDNAHLNVCWSMYSIPFKALVPNDDNRIADAQDLRDRFLQETGLEFGTAIWHIEPTIFEVLVELAYRGATLINGDARHLFGCFVRNLNLEIWKDWEFKVRPKFSQREVDERLNRLNNREYHQNGDGGLFPLRDTNENQREVELWYQMGAWMEQEKMY